MVLGADAAHAFYPDGNPNQAVDDQLAAIARRVLRLDTLLSRGRNALDFRPVGVSGRPGRRPPRGVEAGRADGAAEGTAEAVESPAPPSEASAVLDGVVAEEAEKALRHRKRNGRYDPDGLDHDRLLELLRAVADRAFVAGRTLPPGEVVVTVEGGVVVDVEGLAVG